MMPPDTSRLLVLRSAFGDFPFRLSGDTEDTELTAIEGIDVMLSVIAGNTIASLYSCGSAGASNVVGALFGGDRTGTGRLGSDPRADEGPPGWKPDWSLCTKVEGGASNSLSAE